MSRRRQPRKLMKHKRIAIVSSFGLFVAWKLYDLLSVSISISDPNKELHTRYGDGPFGGIKSEYWGNPEIDGSPSSSSSSAWWSSTTTTTTTNSTQRTTSSPLPLSNLPLSDNNNNNNNNRENHPTMNYLQKVATHHVIVSIATISSRENVLLETIESLLEQSVVPGRIQIHYTDGKSSTSNNNNSNSTGTSATLSGASSSSSSSSSSLSTYPLEVVQKDVSKLLLRRRESSPKTTTTTINPTTVTFHHAKLEWRSSAKLLGALDQLWSSSSDGGDSSKDHYDINNSDEMEPLIVCADDDFRYHNVWLETLVRSHLKYPNVIIGLRGWRLVQQQPLLRYGGPPLHDPIFHDVHPVGIWGSFPPVERYLVMAGKIRQPYQVHVVTHVNGVLYRPSFFDTSIFHNIPSSIHTSMDDIWLSGNAANRSVQRWIVPTYPPHVVPNGEVGVHLGQHKSVIDRKNKGVSRARANDMVIQYFTNIWEQDVFFTEQSLPKLRFPWAFRHWVSENIILVSHGIYTRLLKFLKL